MSELTAPCPACSGRDPETFPTIATREAPSTSEVESWGLSELTLEERRSLAAALSYTDALPEMYVQGDKRQAESRQVKEAVDRYVPEDH